jgi:succinyl-CoA synthetase alpha subunit
MGHAGAIITGTAALAESKVKSLEKAGAFIVPSPADIGTTTKEALRQI